MLTKNTAFSLVALTAHLLLLAIASMAAPACCAQLNGPDMNDIKSRLLSGLRAIDYYVSNNRQGALFITTDSEIGTIIDDLCDLLAYSELVNKINGNGDLQAVLKENINDACIWVKYLNDTHTAVQANADPQASSSCSAEEITYLHVQCLERKVLASVHDPNSVTSKAVSSTQVLYFDIPSDPCMWVDATSMSATRKTAAKSSIGFCQ